MPVRDDVMRLRITFLSGTTPTDPTVVRLIHRLDSDTETTWVYGVDPEIVRDSAGVYRADIPEPVAGRRYWRWEGTGAVSKPAEGSYVVEQGAFS